MVKAMLTTQAAGAKEVRSFSRALGDERPGQHRGSGTNAQGGAAGETKLTCREIDQTSKENHTLLHHPDLMQLQAWGPLAQ